MKVALFSPSFLVTHCSNSFFHLVPLLRRGLTIEFTEGRKIIVTGASSGTPLSLDQMLIFVSNFCGILFPTFAVFCFQLLWYFVSNFCGKFIKGRQTKYQKRQTKRSDTLYQANYIFEWRRIQESNLHGCSHGALSPI